MLSIINNSCIESENIFECQQVLGRPTNLKKNKINQVGLFVACNVVYAGSAETKYSNRNFLKACLSNVLQYLWFTRHTNNF